MSTTKVAKVRATVSYGADRFETPDGMADMDPWTVVLRYRGRQMTTPFYTGYGLRDSGNGEPDAAGVLECLLSDAASVDHAPSFEAWAEDMGWDSDSRKAERTFDAVIRQSGKLRQLLGDDYDDALSDSEAWIEEHTDAAS